MIATVARELLAAIAAREWTTPPDLRALLSSELGQRQLEVGDCFVSAATTAAIVTAKTQSGRSAGQGVR
jgi:hypothetical protein